jgi:hypothetical protein
MKSSQQKIIKLTKIKQWYLVVDAESYKILRDAGAPMVRIHENFLPTIGLLTKRHKIKAQNIPFQDQILNPYLDKIGELWQKKEHRRAIINGSILRFETTHSSILAPAREALAKLEASLRRFFKRWGYSASFDISESRGKIKLHVIYKYDSERLPIIPLVEDAESLPVIRLNLGFVRVSLTPGKRELETNISIASGTDWKSLHTSRCLYSQVSDVRPFINALMEVVNKDHHNFENKP